MNNLSFRQVDITGGFWKEKQDLNRKVTIYSVFDRFKETGRIDAFKCDWKDGMPNKPHFFWDSDVAKWIEGVSYILEKNSAPKLENTVEELIDNIEKNQEATGYFNIYFTVCEPENRFKNRAMHELYCAGHLIEAAVAYFYATKKDRFLKIMCRYADYIQKVFMVEKSAEFVTPGHEEIELALVKLYHCTGEKKYLDLSAFFINQRGANEPDKQHVYDFTNDKQDQSHSPVREQSIAEGHCVRACYLYTAMADLAKEYNDKELLNACKKLYANITQKRMYITGGIGQTSNGEAFTVDYDLPNVTAYAETCAAISLAMFSQRMLNIEANSVYSDTIERVLYNGMLSGISLDGQSFFYENPLEINPILKDRETSVKESNRTRSPITQRVKVFDCSCCPPNLNRVFASVGDFIYSKDNDIYFVNQYMNSELADDDVKIVQSTNYPNDGRIKIATDNVKNIAVRIPYWCKNFTINYPYTIKNGYAYITAIDKAIEINFVIEPMLIQCSTCAQENSGKVALQAGPIIYCIEDVDNGKYLKNISIDKKLNAKMTYNHKVGVNTITADGYRKCNSEVLYAPFDDKYERVDVKFIPYYAFANRGESQMLVWINVK